MQVTATRFPLAVDYRVQGRYYESASGESNATYHPFDTHVLNVGETFELPENTTFQRIRELRGAPQFRPEEIALRGGD